MARPGAVAAGIGVLALLAGWVFLVAMTGRTAQTSQPFVETVGFAISTPAGLVFLTYLTGTFRFDRFYSDRSGPALFGDFLLSVLAAVTAGLPATAAVRSLTDSTTVLFVVAAFVTFLGAFFAFVLRTREYFDWEAEE